MCPFSERGRPVYICRGSGRPRNLVSAAGGGAEVTCGYYYSNKLVYTVEGRFIEALIIFFGIFAIARGSERRSAGGRRAF